MRTVFLLYGPSWWMGLVCLLLVANQGAAQELESDSPEIRTGHFSTQFTQQDARSTVAEVNRRLGEGVRFHPAAFDFDFASESYEVYVPESYDPKQRYGLIVWIGARNHGRIPAEYQALMDQHRLIWIGANESGNDRTPFWIRSMLAIDGAYNIKRLYNIDWDRVYVSGPSGGGRVASMVALIFPDVFTGGGFYVIGCNYMRDLKTDDGRVQGGFWKRPDPRIISVARQRRFAFLTGSNDFNKPGTKRVFAGYRTDGFQQITYLEQPELDHRLPDAKWFEKGLIALDKPLVDAAPDAFATAGKAEEEGDLLSAFKSYRFAATHGHGMDFHDDSKAKVAKLEPRLSEAGDEALKALGADATAKSIRQFAYAWSGYPCSEVAWQRARAMGLDEFEKIDSLTGDERRKALQQFLFDWAGYPFYGRAVDALNSDAMELLREIRQIENNRSRGRKLEGFMKDWAPSPVIALARLDYESVAQSELELVKAIPEQRKRYKKLVSFLEKYPDTKAYSEAVTILNSMNNR